MYYIAQCGNLVPHVFGKHFVKVTFLQKKLRTKEFDETFIDETQIPFIFLNCAL